MSHNTTKIITAIAIQLLSQHSVKVIEGYKLSVITSYTSELEDISKKYNLKMVESFNQQFTVQGIFEVTNSTHHTITL